MRRTFPVVKPKTKEKCLGYFDRNDIGGVDDDGGGDGDVCAYGRSEEREVVDPSVGPVLREPLPHTNRQEDG